MTDESTAEVYPILTDLQEKLLRQVHPSQYRDGKPDSSAFRAEKSHGYLLSTRREAVTPERAFESWSAGTWGIPMQTVHEVELQAFDDSAREDMPDGHASIDFNDLTKSVMLQRARKLSAAAHALGRLYPVADDKTA